MRYPPGAQNVQERMRAHAGNDAVFNRLWQEAQAWHDRSAADPNLPIGYPPGSCAAQGALVLALDDGGLPIAMTERWYHPKGRQTGRSIRYIDATSPTGQWVVVDRPFQQGETVPPCATCEVLVELLLCFQEEDPCNHT